MRLNILLDLPPPPPAPQAMSHSVSVEEKVRDALNLIDSGHESPVEWRMVCRLFRHLQEKGKISRREQNLLDMIQPVLAKYGYHETATTRTAPAA